MIFVFFFNIILKSELWNDIRSRIAVQYPTGMWRQSHAPPRSPIAGCNEKEKEERGGREKREDRKKGKRKGKVQHGSEEKTPSDVWNLDWQYRLQSQQVYN